ncbi:MAG: MerC domain-containing protein [Pseudomonadota bacterium]
MNTRASVLGPDGPAVILSGLCLLHCLALPVLASLVPAFGVLFDHEWLHRGLVLLAVPFTVTALLNGGLNQRAVVFAVAALTGLALLVAAVFVEAFHDWETPMTVIGAVVLASAHVWRWRLLHVNQAGRGAS